MLLTPRLDKVLKDIILVLIFLSCSFQNLLSHSETFFYTFFLAWGFHLACLIQPLLHLHSFGKPAFYFPQYLCEDITYFCCSHVFRETNSLRRTMQIVWSGVYYTGGPKAESPLSQGPQPVFVKTLYTLSVRTQTQLPKFPETSLNKGKERYNQS